MTKKERLVEDSDVTLKSKKKGDYIIVKTFINDIYYGKTAFDTKEEYVCLLFNERPEGTKYTPNMWSWVKREKADEYIENGYAEEYDGGVRPQDDGKNIRTIEDAEKYARKMGPIGHVFSGDYLVDKFYGEGE